MSLEKRPGASSASFEGTSHGGGLAPGKRTLAMTAGDGPVQRQARAVGTGAPPPDADIADRAHAGIGAGGGPVPHQQQMEHAFGIDLGGVRAHTDDGAAAACHAIGANAFAVGHDIAFATPSPDAGLVAHELTHVVQQSGRVQPKMKVGGLGDAFELEADAVGSRVAAGETVHDVAQAHLGGEPLGAHGAASAVQRDMMADLGLGARNLYHNVAEGLGVESHDEAEAARLAAFIGHGVFGPEDLVPPTNIGGFAASYDPQRQVLLIQVRTGITFINGLTLAPTGAITANHTDLAQAAIDGNTIPVADRAAFVADFTWDRGQEDLFITNLQARVEGAWSSAGSGNTFTCTKPGWESLTASVNVDVDVHRGAATGTDHLESTVYKVPDSGQYTITSAVDGNRNDPNSAFDSDAHNNGVEMSSTDVAPTPIENSLLRKSVFFGHDSAALDGTAQGTINAFSADFLDANLDLSNPVELVGHASSSGDDAYNAALSQRRVDAVKAQLAAQGFTGLNDRLSTQAQGELGAVEDPSWRRVDLICGSGEGQLVASHEFGHVFGVLDEYAINPGGTIQGTGNPTGTVVGHDQMARAIGAGGAVAENNDGIMSLGNAVRPQHYATFGWALMQVSGINQWQVGRPTTT
jgi:outer membrane protein OmpA-like peptidoglycan-associated protein